MFLRFIFIVFTLSSLGQKPYHIEYIDQSNGLEQGSVPALVAHKGFMWFSTYDGLSRFDGINIRTYRSSDSSSYLSSNYVRKLTVCKNGYLWLCTDSGLFIYNEATQTFNNFNVRFNQFANNKLFENQIIDLVQSSTYEYFALDGNSNLIYFNLKTHKVSVITIQNNPKIFNLEISNTNRLIAQTSNGLLISDKNIQKFTFASFAKFEINNYVELKDGNGFLLTKNAGAFQVKIHDNKVIFNKKIPNLNSLNIHTILQDHKNNLWIGSKFDGLSFIASGSSTIINLNEKYGFKDRSIWEIVEDEQGIVWIGTATNGVAKIDPNKIRFNSYPDNIIFGMIDWKDQLLIGKADGLWPKLKVFSPIKDNYFNESRTITKDHLGNLWYTTMDKIATVDKTTNKTTTYPLPKSLNLYTWSGVYLPTLKQFWITNENEIFAYDLQKKRVIKKYSKLFNELNTNCKVRSFHYDHSKQKLYIASMGKGFFEVNIADLTYKNYLDCQDFKTIVQRKDGLLLGSNCGLFEYKNHHLKLLANEDSGLPNNVIYGILEDKKQNLWLSSNRGITLVSSNGRFINTYDEQDGLPGLEFNTNAAAKLNNHLYFGSTVGYVAFDPDSIKVNAHRATLKLLKISSGKKNHFTFPKKMYFEPFENFLTFDFALLNQSNSTKNMYSFFLEGIDAQYSSYSTNSTASYTNLPQGKYTFWVKAKNNDGVAANNIIKQNFVVKPRFFESNLFYFLLAFFIGSLLYFYIRYKQNTQKLKRNLEKAQFLRQQEESSYKLKLSEIELNALRSQMNPHFIFNCLNSIKLYSLENNGEGASVYLTKFSKLIRLVLENSRTEKVILNRELETLVLYIEMETMRFKDKLAYEIKVDEDIETELIELPPLVIQPYVENAIWHGLMHKDSGGKVTVHVSQPQSNCLEICIEDNGIGRAKAMELNSKSATKEKSFGMKVTSDRLTLINQMYKINTSVQIRDLLDENGEGCGTIVKLNIPI